MTAAWNSFFSSGEARYIGKGYRNSDPRASCAVIYGCDNNYLKIDIFLEKCLAPAS